MTPQPTPAPVKTEHSEDEKTFLKTTSLQPMQSVRDYMRSWPLRPGSKLVYECFAEFWGTMMIVVFGVGSVNAAVAVGAHADLWHVAMMWGFGVAMAIYCSVSVSGAHLNPAVSLAFAVFRSSVFPWSKVPWYCLAQLLGGIAGGAMNFLIYFPFIGRAERLQRLETPGFSRGGTGSEISAMVFGEYFPNPDWVRANEMEGEDANQLVSTLGALCVEAWATGILLFVIMALTDDRQKFMLQKELVPFLIGVTVSVLVGLYAPLTQMCLNPARDFGPRLVAAMAGWGDIAIPGPRDGFWIYILGPIIGGQLGSLAYVVTLEPGLRMGE